MSNEQNKWNRELAPPPPLFFNDKEKNFVKQITDEVTERIIGQQIVYYPISKELTKYHEIYGEAMNKAFLDPIHIYALVEWEQGETETPKWGIDRKQSLIIHFQRRRIVEDLDLRVTEGDFVQYGNVFYEIVKLIFPKNLFGQVGNGIEVTARCIRARQGTFDIGE